MFQLIARGFTSEEISNLQEGEAEKLLAIDLPVLVTEKEVLAYLLHIKKEKKWSKLAQIKGFMSWATEDTDPDEQLTLAVGEFLVDKKLAKQAKKAGTWKNKADNRLEYIPQGTLVYDGKRCQYITAVGAPGILSRIVGQSSRPPVFRIINTQEKDNDKGLGEIPEKLLDEGYLVSQEKLAWDMRNPMVRSILLATFPLAIDFGGYTNRLEAPLSPDGFLKDITIHFGNPSGAKRVVDQEKVLEAMRIAAFQSLEGWVKDEQLIRLGEKFKTITLEQLKSLMANTIFDFEKELSRATQTFTTEVLVDQECDGSGLYNPNAPELATLVARYGAVPLQYTLLRPDGLFAKGILVPREGLAQSFLLDMAQVKGSWKGKVSEGQQEDGCFIGIMRAFSTEGTYPGCFELLQFLKVNDDTKSIVDELVEESLSSILKDGIEGLIEEACAMDANLGTLRKVVAQIRAHGIEVNPMGIPMIRDAVNEVLGARLWKTFQGAGITGRQLVTVLDATVPKGCCVVPGFKVGTEVAIWRYPNVLPAGLVTCKVITPTSHQMVNGKLIPTTIWLNPLDLTLSMQGDDDGDIVGVSSDPRILKLFGEKLFQGIYQVESGGVKLKTQTLSKEGVKYIRYDPRGPVGITTLHQAQLLAVGDYWGALALARINQEAIDSAKKSIPYTDPEFAAQPGNWSQVNGIWHMREGGEYTGSAPFFEHLGLWCYKRRKARGCDTSEKTFGHNPVAWRRGGKRFYPLSEDKLCREQDNGWGGGNLVHYCADSTILGIQKRKEEWLCTFSEALDFTEGQLLRGLLELKGILVPKTDWNSYQKLRERSGLMKFKTAFGNAIKRHTEKDDVDEKRAAIADAVASLQSEMRGLKVEELCQIFEMELTPSLTEEGVQKNTPNFGWRVFFPGSPLLPLLGLEDEEECQFMTIELTEKIASWALKQEDCFKAVSSQVLKNTTHQHSVGPMLIECPTCLERLQTGVVKAWRKERSYLETAELRRLVRLLNGTL